MKIPVILLIVLGAALAAISLMLSNPANPTAIEKLLPKAIEGFSLAARIDRVEPGFIEQGERYSSHASFTPLAGSVYEKRVDMLGIAIFLFKNEQGAKQVKALLLSGAQTEIIKISDRAVELFSNEDFDQVGILWQDKGVLYEILVTAPKEGEVDRELLKRAALAAAQAVLKAAGPQPQ